MGGARPIGTQRPARRNSIVGHAENRRAGGPPCAILVPTVGAGRSAPAAAAARIRASTASCGSFVVAAGRISRFADLPRAADRPTRAGNGRSAPATANGSATSSPSAMGTACRCCSTTTSTTTATAARCSTGCRRDDPCPGRGRSRRGRP